MKRRAVGPELIWNALLAEGTALLKQQLLTNSTIVMEVGMNKATSCLEAAAAGFEAHCFEPSPASYQNCLIGVDQYKRAHNNTGTIERVHIFNAAAGSRSNGTVHFLNSKSTGAHVIQDEDVSKYPNGSVVDVPMMKLDDVIRSFSGAFMVKVDVQGFEPEIFRGLQDSISNHKVQYVLMEYWPRGMDQMASATVKCQVSLQILNHLVEAGYSLFQLKVAFHPREPWGQRQTRAKYNHGEYPPTDLAEHCQWFYDMEEKEPAAYHHGYWTDVLAVAPGSLLPEEPLTNTGKILKELRMASTID